MKKISSLILRIAITSVLLLFLFAKTDFKSLAVVVRQAHPGYLAQAFLLFLFLNILIIFRWEALLNGLHLDIPLSRVAVSYASSLFFNLVLPSTIGGDAVRTLDIARHTHKHSSSILATVVLDRASGFFGLMTVLLLALIFGFPLLADSGVFVVALILLGLAVFLAGLSFSRRFFHMLFKYIPFKKIRDYFYLIHESTAGFKEHPRILWRVWFLSCLVQAGMPLVYYWAARALGTQVPFIYFFIFVPLISAISVIPVSIGGLGVRDTASVALFSKVGMVAEQAFAVSLINFAFILLSGILGGLIYVFTFHRRRV